MYVGSVGSNDDGWELALALIYWGIVVTLSIGTMLVVYFILRLPKQHLHKHTHKYVCGCMSYPTVTVLLGYILLSWSGGDPVTPWQFLCDRHDLLAVVLSPDVGHVAWLLRVLKLGVTVAMCFLMTMMFTSAGLDRMGDKIVIVDDPALNTFIFYVMAVSASSFTSFAVRFANMAAKGHGTKAVVITGAVIAGLIVAGVSLGVYAVGVKFEYSGASPPLIREWWGKSSAAFGISVLICFLVTQPLSTAILYGLGIALLADAETALEPSGVKVRNAFWQEISAVHYANLWMQRVKVGRFREGTSATDDEINKGPELARV